MALHGDLEVARELSRLVKPLRGDPADFAGLLEAIGDAQIVLLGEASHGTHEFYRLRAELTRRLIVDKNFTIVAVEADWPDAYRVNRFVRGLGRDTYALDALADFRRFPAWMWRNGAVLEFVRWLRYENEARPADDRVGFYGLDLYSLHTSIQRVIEYLGLHHPGEARRARERYACFDHFGVDPQQYALATVVGGAESCEDEVVTQLLELQRQRDELLLRDGHAHSEEFLYAEQNARVVKNAEHYYRAMFRADASSWNLRDQHMADTIDALLKHFQALRKDPVKLVVWAHNSHVGDARATDRALGGELNVGQLVRERHAGQTFSLGFSTFDGTVTAASDWDGPAERKVVRRALSGSWEDLLHRVGIPRHWLLSSQLCSVSALHEARLQRAIGVIYRPASERVSHYYRTQLLSQFDALIHIDRTRAVEPLEQTATWQRGELPETYPTGM
jgi:erythromycin esterase-like protein